MEFKISQTTYLVTSSKKFDLALNREVVVYTLKGPRGAVYSTQRNMNKPEYMFLINNRKFGVAFNGLWLTDKDGELRVV
jgi:hypothetical protein